MCSRAVTLRAYAYVCQALAAVCTAFASVYFEKMLKGASKPSLWLRNIQA